MKIIIRKVPYKCPICNGAKEVHHTLYDTAFHPRMTADSTRVSCKSCYGTGLVYGDEKTIMDIPDAPMGDVESTEFDKKIDIILEKFENILTNSAEVRKHRFTTKD